MKRQFLSLIALTIILPLVILSCGNNAAVTGVTLSKLNITLGVGETETLIATIIPEKAANKSVIWTSSNVLVATVMPNGLVTALSKGNTTIVVTTVDGSYSESCAVKVDEIPVTSILLNKNSLVLDIDETETLIATVLPENATIKEVYYSSSKPHIATVGLANGAISPIGLGTTTITVTTLDGGKTDKCELEVIKRVKVTGVTLNKTNMNLGIGTSAQLEANVTPYNATNKNVSWSSTNPSIASVDGVGHVFALSDGTSFISVTTDDGGFTAQCEVKCINFSPPILTTLEATDITIDYWGTATATVGGNITYAGDPEYIERGVRYCEYISPNQNQPEWGPTIRNKIVSGTGTGTFTTTITLDELEYFTWYVCAYVKTSLGITYGNVVSITAPK